MEFRLLQYFLAIAREETILKAAESLNVTQPTLIKTNERNLKIIYKNSFSFVVIVRLL